MPRRILVVVLAFLLLGMQLEAHWHALGHLGDWLQRPHEQGLQLPEADGPCAICALLAGGVAAAPGDRAAPTVDPVRANVLQLEVTSPTAAAPSFYLSRAPPALL